MKRTPLSKTGKSTYSKLKRHLDSLFSTMIKERDKGMPCIDLCGRKGNYQAGHFRRRELMSTRWHPQNVNGQNEYCNAFDNDGYRHALGIDKRWGEGTADDLFRISQRTKKWDKKELQQLIEATKDYQEYVDVYTKLK